MEIKWHDFWLQSVQTDTQFTVFVEIKLKLFALTHCTIKDKSITVLRYTKPYC